MAGESGSFWQLERVNRRRTAALVVKVILAFAAFGLGLDFRSHNLRFSDGRLSGIPWFTAIAMILAIMQALRANFAGADLVLDALDAHPISSDQPKNQTVIDVVREMALAARIPEPRVEVIDDPSPNAFAVGRDPEHSAICVTQGLLDQMDREELQGVIGHEMAHIRNCDTRLTTMVTAMFRGFGVLRFISGMPVIWKARSASDGIVSRIISTILSRDREYLADASAVEFTRNPTALIRALEQIAKTESPLRCATPGMAQLFIVDPFERAGGATSYKQYINEITRLRLQPGKTQEERDEDARKFAVSEYPRNMLVGKLSNHPPLGERIERLQALIHAKPGAAAASSLTDEELRAKFSESATFVRNLANTDPEVMARIMASALLALPAGRTLLEEKIGATQNDPDSTSPASLEQKLYEANLASTGDLQRSRTAAQDPLRYASALASVVTGDLPSALDADPPSGKGISQPESIAEEAQRVEALAKVLAPIAASMRPKEAAPRPAAVEQRTGSAGVYLFWRVIALSAGAIVASIAAR
ncbi:MAG: M48 family metalloprotease [Candidatus Binatus sp.]